MCSPQLFHLIHNDQFATVTVKDTGVGISEKNLQKLFCATGNFKCYGTNNEEGTVPVWGLYYAKNL
ncbi:MAG: ATP-binding protein [Bacteroidales bacterium]